VVGDVDGARVDHVEAELGSQRAPAWMDLADDDAGSCLARNERDEKADRPAADHDRGLAG
jgi:hypothetical protein